MTIRPFLIAAALLALPGTVPAQTSLDFIRVAVVRADPEVSLQIHGRFTISALHTGTAIQQGRRLPPMSVRAVQEGIQLGDEVIPVYGVRVEPERSATISLNGKRLRGTLEIVRQKNLTLLIINHVALEEYLRGVLSKEAPDYWPEEALKAIAIAARTYAVYQRASKAQVDYDVTGDVMSQDYGGKTAEKAATTRAVKETAGLILAYHGKLFPTFYHSTCGGMTEHSRVMGDYNIEPLQGGIACSLCAASPFFKWQRRLTRADLAWALRKSSHGSIGTIRDVRVTKRTPSGRAQEITLSGSLRTLRLTGYDLRVLLGFEQIRSTFFTVEPVGDDFVVEGHGWGHGVGLCQWGSAELARRGLLAPEILSYYYRGAALVSLQDVSAQPIQLIGGTP